MTTTLMELPNMREAASAVDAVLLALGDDQARALCSLSFLVCGVMALRFFTSGPTAIHYLNELAELVATYDAEDGERVMQ